MSTESRVRVFIASSLDGFVAGPGDDLSWLPGPSEEPVEHAAEEAGSGAMQFDEFMADVGALLMGRRTYEVVAGFDGPWPYGERPVLVATHRPLEPAHPMVRAVSGEMSTMIAEAKSAAGDRDVYLDGGNLIRQAMDAKLVDDLILTMVPVVLGAGHSLFGGLEERHRLEFYGHHSFPGGLLQLHCRPIA